MIRCSFCNKKQNQVAHIIAGHETEEGKSYICNECIEFSYGVLQQATQTEEAVTTDISVVVKNPNEIHEELNKFIIGQEYAKRVFAVAIYNHFKRINHTSKDIELHKSNILMLGPSGSGKSFLVKTIANMLNIPFATADATSITEAGYMGDDVESMIERLIQNANGDVAKAERGIIFIDEIDKKVKKSNNAHQRDISGEGVQQALLKIVEGTVVRVPGKKILSEPIDFDTSKVLFIVGGAFVGLDQQIKKNLGQIKTIGFNSDHKEESLTDTLLKVTPKDLIDFGIIPEFVGRFPIMVPLHALSEDDLISILQTPKNNLVQQYKELFKIEEVELEFDKDFLRSVAKESIRQQIGARGLRSIMEKTLLDLQYELPMLVKSGVTNIKVNSDGTFLYVSNKKKAVDIVE